MFMPKEVRVDQLLFERGLAESRSQAQRLVMAGQVRANGEVVPKPSSQVDPGVELSVDRQPRFVSRGGEKLQAAFDTFELDVAGRTCVDIGASTGGFTDCLLQHGATKVYAIDVGRGILHWKLRNDPRVVIMEGTNARHLESLPEPVSFVTVDASFISLTLLLPVVRGWFAYGETRGVEKQNNKPEEQVIALIKPQFEAGRQEVARGKGVIRDPVVHRRILEDVLRFALEIDFEIKGLLPSPVLGPKGNQEFLAWLGFGTQEKIERVAIECLVSQALAVD
jgi:23S rRNA (cytidine1920-2'-O)/16S rRNA (cytidine1409-2'-O)-methyltransferase